MRRVPESPSFSIEKLPANSNGAAPALEISIEDLIPTADELFGPRPKSPRGPVPPAWDAEFSIAVELTIDTECVRRLGNICLYDPPIEEEEIQRYADHFGVSRRQAEIELREMREDQ